MTLDKNLLDILDDFSASASRIDEQLLCSDEAPATVLRWAEKLSVDQLLVLSWVLRHLAGQLKAELDQRSDLVARLSQEDAAGYARRE